MFQAQNRVTINSAWKVALSFKNDHYDDERDKTVFHKTTPELEDQDQDRFFLVSDRSCPETDGLRLITEVLMQNNQFR